MSARCGCTGGAGWLLKSAPQLGGEQQENEA